MSVSPTGQSEFWRPDVDGGIQEIGPITPPGHGAGAEEWAGGIHPEAKLELTRGYYLYADKLSHVLSYLAHERQPDAAVYDQLAQATGMPHPRVEALAQYGVNMELLIPRTLTVTPLYRLIFEHDRFFDQHGTLWLLHYLFASNPQLLVWNYMCNAILPAVEGISRADAADRFLPFVGKWSESSIRKKVRKELRAFFISYVAEMFAPLSYLREVRNNVYTVTRDVAPVPPPILLATALIYRDRFHPGSSGVEIPTLIYADHSPGRILRQSELRIRRALNDLHETGYLTIESRANLDQIRFRGGMTWLEAVQTYYSERSRG